MGRAEAEGRRGRSQAGGALLPELGRGGAGGAPGHADRQLATLGLGPLPDARSGPGPHSEMPTARLDSP